YHGGSRHHRSRDAAGQRLRADRRPACPGGHARPTRGGAHHAGGGQARESGAEPRHRALRRQAGGRGGVRSSHRVADRAGNGHGGGRAVSGRSAPRVLIGDADPNKLSVLKAALVHAAYHVASATSASFALTTLERDRPDLIVSGNRTEDMDGVEFCSIIRSDPATHDIPFLLLSGPKRPTPWAVAQAGVDMLLAGDFVVSAVLDRIAKLLRHVAVKNQPATVAPPPAAAAPARPPLPLKAAPSRTAAERHARGSLGGRVVAPG